MADEIGFDSAAWSIDGARIDSALMRVLAYAGTGGSEGIVTAGDCRVHQLETPGSQIAIDTGAVLVRNRSVGGKNQTYVANGRTQTLLDTPDSNPAAMSHLVVVRLEDPEFPGWVKPSPEDAPTYQYTRPFIIQNVPPTTRKFSELNLGYSAYALTRIDQPANTAAITDGMLVDLREVANPRRETYLERFDITYAPNDSGSLSDTWIHYPDVPYASIEVPDFAAVAKVKAWVIGAMVRDNPMAGYFRFRMTGGSPEASIYTKQTYFNEQNPGDSRVGPYLIGSTVDIPAALRGQTVQGAIEFLRNGGTGFMRSHADVQVVVEIDFIEAAS